MFDRKISILFKCVNIVPNWLNSHDTYPSLKISQVKKIQVWN